MTDDVFSASDEVSSHFADRVTRAQEVAAGARKKAIDDGVHEHVADSVYAGVFQATVMKLHDAECDHCSPKNGRSRSRGLLGWLITDVVLVAFYVALTVWNFLNADLVVAGFDSFMAGVFVCVSVWQFRRWRKS